MSSEVKNVGRYQDSVLTQLIVGTRIAVREVGGHCYSQLKKINDHQEFEDLTFPFGDVKHQPTHFCVWDGRIEFWPQADRSYEFTICGEERS